MKPADSVALSTRPTLPDLFPHIHFLTSPQPLIRLSLVPPRRDLPRFSLMPIAYTLSEVS
jgi:hypothetical protein